MQRDHHLRRNRENLLRLPPPATPRNQARESARSVASLSLGSCRRPSLSSLRLTATTGPFAAFSRDDRLVS